MDFRPERRRRSASAARCTTGCWPTSRPAGGRPDYRQARGAGRQGRVRARAGSGRSTTAAGPGCTGRGSTAGAARRRSSSSSSPRSTRASGAPPMIDIGVGPGLVGPTLIHHGTEEQKRRFLPRDPHRRRRLVPGLLRAERRLRPRRLPHARRARRRRLPRHRPEDLDQLRALRRLVHPGRAHRLRRRRSTRASRSCCVDMKSPGITIRPLVEMTGRRLVQRGLLRRRAGAARATWSAS